MNNEKENITNFDYYKAYDKRYKQVYEKNMLWSSKKHTSEVYEYIISNNINKNAKILDLGCGEGRDAIYLLDNGYDVLAIDYSQNAINKCNELSNNKYTENFKQFDLLKDLVNEKYDFIYSIAVLHMFVLNKDRNKFLTFIKEHLNKNSKALICILGDGVNEYASNIEDAFVNTKRLVMNNNVDLDVVTTSCGVVNWNTLEKEVTNNGLKIKEKWISTKIPEFNSSMCIIVEINN